MRDMGGRVRWTVPPWAWYGLPQGVSGGGGGRIGVRDPHKNKTYPPDAIIVIGMHGAIQLRHHEILFPSKLWGLHSCGACGARWK